MGTEDFNKELISYLYDEMSTEERIQFEKEMDANPELKKEFLSMKEVRSGLSQVEDKEVMEPFFLWGKNGMQQWPNPFKKNALIMFKPFIAVAASLVILLMVGYFTKFNIQYNEKGLLIGFNNPVQTTPSLTEDQIANLVKQGIAKNNSVILTRLNETENEFKSQLSDLKSNQEKARIYQASNDLITKEDLQHFVKNNQNNNSIILKEYLQTASIQQQEYFQSVLGEFSDYLQQQRNNDLLMIQRSIVTLKDKQDEQKQQTETLLANIINNVNNQNN